MLCEVVVAVGQVANVTSEFSHVIEAEYLLGKT
jgi:hypothetical protein